MDFEGTVFVVDDDPRVRKSLGRLFESVNRPFRLFSTASEFLDTYSPSESGCLVLDVRMPGTSGMALHRQMVARGLTLPVILISGHGDVPMACEAMRRGAVDFLQKPVNPQQLLDRVQEALALDAERRRISDERTSVEGRVSSLTSREREVVDLAVTGLTNKQIAARLGVSPQAIDVRRTRALEKMHVSSVPELVRLMLVLEVN